MKRSRINYSDESIGLVLRQALDEQRARLAEIEASRAWRVGGLMSAMLRSPLRDGPRNALRLVRLIGAAARSRRSPASGGSRRLSPPPEGMTADCLVYGPLGFDTEWSESQWLTDDAGMLVACLQARRSPGVLVLRHVDLTVVRPLARLKEGGWRLVWSPLADEPGPAHLVRYVSELADECVSGCGS